MKLQWWVCNSFIRIVSELYYLEATASVYLGCLETVIRSLRYDSVMTCLNPQSHTK